MKDLLKKPDKSRWSKLQKYIFDILVASCLIRSLYYLGINKRHNFLRLADEKDIQTIYNIVKAAYTVEMGNSGVSFKNADRYISTKSVLKDLPFIWVLRENEEMIGCIKGVVSHNGQIVEIGPVAVRPDKQVRK